MSDADALAYRWHHDGRVTTLTWMGDEEVAASRVYALAFVPSGEMHLVNGGAVSPDFWLPGGGIEPGETEECALARELREEAGATILDSVRLGAQRSEDPVEGVRYHVFYWARIRVDPTARTETEMWEVRLVPTSEFLDVLFWGRSDPKAAMLLERAMHIERTR